MSKIMVQRCLASIPRSLWTGEKMVGTGCPPAYEGRPEVIGEIVRGFSGTTRDLAKAFPLKMEGDENTILIGILPDRRCPEMRGVGVVIEGPYKISKIVPGDPGHWTEIHF